MVNSPTKNKETVYGEVITYTNVDNQEALDILHQGKNISNAFNQVTQDVSYNIQQFNHAIQGMENSNQRYINAQNTKQWIINNEVHKYNELMQKQNNLLNRINYLEIKFWRYKNKLYFRTTNGQLIIDNHIEIQKELSSRYGSDVFIVNDMNDTLKNINQYRVNTIFIAINNIIVVEEEVFDNNQDFEIFNTYNGGWRRNLLAYTRYSKKGIIR